MTDTVKLIVKTGNEINKSFDLIKDKIVIGRDPDSDIIIDTVEVSRSHATITREGNTFQIEDQNSTNGTFLNGRKLKKPTVIKNGDLISLGENHVLEFVYEKANEIPESLQQDEIDQSQVTRVEDEIAKIEKPSDEIPEPSSQLGETDQSMVTQIEDEIAEVEKLLKERVHKEKPGRTNKKDRNRKTSSQKSGDQKKSTWVIILLAALAFIVIFCVIPLIVIEVSNQWCNLFAGFFNSMSPGVCP